MNPSKNIICFNITLLGLVFFSISFIDKPLSNFIAENLSLLAPFFNSFTIFSDKIAAFILFKLFGSLPLFLLFNFLIGLVFLLSKKTEQVGFIFLILVIAYPTTTVLTNIMKVEFKRARPAVYLQGGENTVDFYSQQLPNDSFPSGHATFYLSWFLPAALAFRKYAPFILLIPAIIILGRVVQNHHYLSDVLCAIVIVSDFCLLTYWILSGVGNMWINFSSNRRERRKQAGN